MLSVSFSFSRPRTASKYSLGIRRVKLENDKISFIRQVVAVAVRIVRGIRLGRSTVGELIGGMREDSVPPVKHAMWITFFVCRVVSRASTGRNCYHQSSAYAFYLW